jgi:hypothetical protein
MSEVGNTIADKLASAPRQGDGFPRRSFLGRIDLLGMGAAALSADAAP